MSFDMKDVRKKFNSHKSGARVRGIEFKLTFEEWWEIWKPFWANRGRKVGQFVMCRTMDSGAYEVGNVRIDTPRGNASTRKVVSHCKKMEAIKSAYSENSLTEYDDEDDGWLPKELRNPYRSQQENWGMR